METRTPMESVERIIVYLSNGQSVVGNLHVPRHSRMLDILNHQADIRPFFALTDVEWHLEGTVVRHNFVCLNRAQVLAVHPAK